MKIALLSVCAMMFMLYGTDCRADMNAEDSVALQKVKSESFKPVFAKNRRNSLKNEKHKDVKRSKQDVSNSKESDEEFYDAVDPEYNAWLEKKNRDEKNSAESKANKNSRHRDGRSYADVVKGEQDEVNRGKLAESIKDKNFEQRNAKIKRGFVDEKRRFFEENSEKNSAKSDRVAEADSSDNWLKDQKNYKLKNKWENKSHGRWEKESAENKSAENKDEKTDSSDNWLKDQKNYKLKNKWKNKSYGRWEKESAENFEKADQSQADVKEFANSENQDKPEEKQVTKKKQNKIAPPQTSRSKKAYEARKNKQNAANQDEFDGKWKSANKSSNYVR